ncbi:SNF2 family N-terminal domain-containing protein, partial [Kickxella alabastrina]|uniref:SNF2 family N-terminal domain-containing protein n=1 Tax=Kickxella alabastrina TaxID=61397 RepID=UPI00221F20AA
MVYHSTIPDSLRGIEATKSNCGTFPFLIVVPSTLIDNWMAEFRAWAPFLVVCKLSGQAASREIQLETTLFRKQAQGKLDLCCHVVLASYESIIKRGIPQFTNPSFIWQAIVFDEGHRLKNNQSKTYQELKKFNAHQRVVLTGTPLQNDLRELFNLLGFIDPDKSNEMVNIGASFDVTDERSVGLVRDMINPYILRRTRDKIPDLVPPKYELILPVPMSELQRKLYRATLTKNTKLLYDIARALRKNDKNMGTGAGSIASLQNVLMEVRKIVSHPYLISGIEPTFETTDEATRHLISSCGKLQVLHAMMPELRTRGHRMLIFSQFKDTLIILQDYFDAQGITYCHIDGDTPQ